MQTERGGAGRGEGGVEWHRRNEVWIGEVGSSGVGRGEIVSG